MPPVFGTTASNACGDGGGPHIHARGRVGPSVVARRRVRRESSHRHRADRPPLSTARACADLSRGIWVHDPPMFTQHGREYTQDSSKEASKNVPKKVADKGAEKVAETSPKRSSRVA